MYAKFPYGRGVSKHTRIPAILLYLLIAAGLLPAFSGVSNVQGEFSCINCNDREDYILELRDDATHTAIDRSYARPNSNFIFRNVNSGQYKLTVTRRDGSVVKEVPVNASSTLNPVNIVIEGSPQRHEKASGETVSVGQLKHKIPKAANKEFQRASELKDKGDLEGAIAALEKAVQIDPEFMEAYNSLGARYMTLKRNEQALAAFQKAAELDPHSTPIQSNIALVLIHLGRMEEAEQAAKRGLDASTRSAYVYGIALFNRMQYTVEAIKYLQKGADEFPNARIPAARIMAVTGRTEDAKRELYKYMEVAPEQDRPMIAKWIKSLDGSQSRAGNVDGQ